MNSSLLTSLILKAGFDENEARGKGGRWSSTPLSSSELRKKKPPPMEERWMTLESGKRIPNLQTVQDHFGFFIMTEHDSRKDHKPGTVFNRVFHWNGAEYLPFPEGTKLTILGHAAQLDVDRQYKFLYGSTKGSRYYHVSAYYKARAE